MAGDYDNGESRVETLRNYVGEELFNQYVENCPDLYKLLSDLDNKNTDK